MSSEHDATMVEGDLFTVAIGETPPSDVAHIGNTRWTDRAMAKAVGLRAVPITCFNPNRFEEIFAATGPAGGILAAASRLGRSPFAAEVEETSDPSELVLAEIGASVAGLAFGSFVLWARDESRARGLTNVAFSARDGHLPMQIAASLPDGYWDECQPLYMHGNRKTLSVAGAAALGVRPGSTSAHSMPVPSCSIRSTIARSMKSCRGSGCGSTSYQPTWPSRRLIRRPCCQRPTVTCGSKP
ncbi:MAG: hypothetical protein R2706_07700 [Acidimicrobiales bacterium]